LATVKQHGAEHGLEWAANAISQSRDGRYHVTDASQQDAVFGLREQPEAASAMAAEFASDNNDFLAKRLDRPIEPVDLYLAHFLGAGGAARFLSAHAADPSAPAAPIMADAAASNHAIFYRSDGSARSFDEIRSSFATRLEQGINPPTPVQFAQSISTNSQTVSTSSTTINQLAMRTIEPMPTRLSLDFARNAYQRLASLDGGMRS
jgi:hypothetical protein